MCRLYVDRCIRIVERRRVDAEVDVGGTWKNREESYARTTLRRGVFRSFTVLYVYRLLLLGCSFFLFNETKLKIA